MSSEQERALEPAQTPHRYCPFAIAAFAISGGICLILFAYWVITASGVVAGGFVDSVLDSAAMHRFELAGGLSKSLAVSSVFCLLLAGVSAARLSRNRSFRGWYLVGTSVILSVIILSAVSPARSLEANAEMIECGRRLKALDQALMAYLEEHNGQLPDHARWQEALTPYIKDPYVLRCSSDDTGPYSYAMDSAIDPNLAANPVDLVLFFECKPGCPQSGGKELLDARHSGGCWVIYPDLHIEFDCIHVIDQLRWTADDRPHE